mmetsp:Transcript_11545/g.37910  ORF Transcript_11545/g.37910 Transcript_11545/m.37910 type:complete len:240 (-) Transcript_11545:1395-2114(-)
MEGDDGPGARGSRSWLGASSAPQAERRLQDGGGDVQRRDGAVEEVGPDHRVDAKATRVVGAALRVLRQRPSSSIAVPPTEGKEEGARGGSEVDGHQAEHRRGGGSRPQGRRIHDELERVTDVDARRRDRRLHPATATRAGVLLHRVPYQQARLRGSRGGVASTAAVAQVRQEGEGEERRQGVQGAGGGLPGVGPRAVPHRAHLPPRPERRHQHRRLLRPLCAHGRAPAGVSALHAAVRV